MTDVRSGTALVTVGGELPIDPIDGAVHIFVDPVNGSDEHLGLSPSNAFLTIQTAVARMNDWLALEIAADFVMELANGTYNEDVQFFLQSIPRGRVLVRGDSTTMTELATGTLTAATAQLVTDAGAAFGVLNQYTGKIIEVFDPASPATTLQQKTIRVHTNTAVSPVGPFSAIPVAGWTYRILEPAAVIQGQGSGAFAQNPALRVVCPWDTPYDGGDQFPGSAPMLGFAFIKIIPAVTFGLTQVGGYVQYTGILIEGPGDGFLILSGTAAAYGGFPGIVDPLYQTSLTYSPNVDACIGTRVQGFTGDRIDLQGQFFGSLVVFESDFFMQGAVVTLFGGAIHGGAFDSNEQSELQIFGGGVNAADPLLPFLVRAAPSTGILIREGSHAEVVDTEFDACNAGAFLVSSGAFLRVLPTITAGLGDVPGVGIWCQDGGKAAVGSGVTFTAGTDLRVGNGVDADGNSTFAALTLSAPLIDHPNDNGRGAMGVQPGSLASIWEI